MSTVRPVRIETGSRVRITKDVDMGYIKYLAGHEFVVTGSDGMRGLDLKDDDGNVLAETRFIHQHIELVKP